MLLLTFAVGRADVEFMVDGPCPETARTVRPQGTERCDRVTAQALEQSIATPSSRETATAASSPRDDLARLGQIERWLLPTVVLTGGALAIGMVAWALRRLYQKRNTGDSIRRTGRSVIQVVVATVIAGLVAWQAAGVTFQRMFSSFDNHDTAAPALIAAPVALAVFIAVAWLSFAASAWILRILSNAIRTRR